MIITGLRGVGKTVLLSEFRDRAMQREWVVIDIEISKHDDDQFRAVLARELRKALFAVAPRAKWADRTRRAARETRFRLLPGPPRPNHRSGRLDARCAAIPR